MTRRVNIELDSTALKKINQAGQSVVMVRPIQGWVAGPTAASAAEPNVIWAVLNEPLMNNVISWENQYKVFVTTSPQTEGSVITINAHTEAPAQPGEIYVFKTGYFTAMGAGSLGEYIAQNQMQGSFAFGVCQPYTVNATTAPCVPLVSRYALYNQEAYFTPTDNFQIFLSSYARGGTITFSVPGGALFVKLDASNPTATIAFNNENNSFYLLP